MNKLIKITYFLILFCFVSCTSRKDIVITDFESGTYGNWVTQGDAFGNAPRQGTAEELNQALYSGGKFLIDSFNGGDDSQGSLTSPEFTIERSYINLFVAGGVRPGLYIELLIDGKPIYTARPIVENGTLNQMTWDVKMYEGQKAVIRIVDNQKGDWGHILAGKIDMSDESKSDILINHKITFTIDKKYILIPIEDKGSESYIYLQQDDKKVSPRLDIRIAQSKIDYWMPINVEEFKGKKLDLLFNYVKKGDIGYSQIKESDTFDFNYNETYRPHYHFSPQYGWTNDPNGMVYFDGEYHLFFQYNPYGTRWANMNWGHAVTKDLKRWETLPVAISPDSLGAIFSGSAVIDKNNTAGFGKDAMIAIYTNAGEKQVQSLAYSLDKGRTFTKYEGNPVLTDPNIVDFRDPKVFWHESTQKWIMALATSQTITLYGSKNFKEWEQLSSFGEGIGGHGGVWECPDLFPLVYNGQTKWVLLVNINPGGPNGGSANQYFIGSFDGKTFKPDNLPYPLWVDYGRDNYAGITWSNTPDGRALFIGWMSNWDYANDVPTEYFRSAMTVPRELKLRHNGKHLVLANYPAKEIDGLRSETKNVPDVSVNNTFAIDKLLENNTGAFEIEMTVKTNNVEGFNFKLKNRKGEELSFIFDLSSDKLVVDRSKSGLIGFNEKFAPATIEAPMLRKSEYKVRLLIDKASSELFVNDGELVQTNIIFPTEPYNMMDINCLKGTMEVKNIKIYNLK